MAANKKSHAVSISLVVILAIVLFVISLLIVIRITQTSYSHKVASITFTSQSGPVSPEFQSTQTLTLTPTSCEYSVEKVQPPSTQTTPCKMDEETFQKIVTSFNTYAVGEKIHSNSGQPQPLIGGKTQTITVKLQDGTELTAHANKSFLDSIGPFISDVELYVPQMNNLQF